ncbi:D-alanyl-D-alanine carboxypeptidase [Streptomyces sp. gb1(2016)]|uniref:D-alanyl-D-alanine carboxypeptidase n=1 Tax=Streptomyces sp. gb1(2016) TaxID=1828321 RepID=A0A652KJB2_9ACTN|nr:D-alanyl-D-alanine carboxypeptidase [Streptomyces sp. gb1(2016)]
MVRTQCGHVPAAHKEVSVAGESPDKSEQRKSSGSAEERDPRFAVFREPVAAAGGNTAGGTAGAAKDSKTAVFRLPRSADADASAERESTDPPEGAEGPAGSEGPEEASTPRGGAGEPAKAEGAAGQATKAPEAPVDATGPVPGGTGARSGSEGEDGAEGEDRAEAESEAAEGPGAEAERTGADELPEAASGDAAADAVGDASDVGEGAGAGTHDDAGTGDDAEAGEQPEAASGSAAGSGSESGSGDEPTPTDARLRAAVAAWVATGPDEESAAQGGATADDKPSGGDDKPSGDSGEAAGGSAAVSADPKATTPADRKAAAPAGEKPADTDEPPADADADADDAKAPAAEADDDAKAPAADADADSDADAPAADADKASADAPRVPKTREEADPAKDADPASDGRGIDHPTAVFKAPRAERVDQPTTALKLPSKEKEAARKPASWAAKASGAAGAAGAPEAPESSAERTSKFVPLRSDDVRPAPVVGPTITPDVAAGPGTPASPGAGIPEAERTRQQPMPPRPPLDLLAELTNTPPPPETPVRTAVRRVKIWTPLLLLVLIIFAIAQAVRPLPDPALTLSAAPTYTFGGEKLDMPWPEEGQGAVEVEGVGAIGSYGKEKSAPIASMAKVMTAYVILQGHPITGKETGEQITVDKQAGEEASLEDESRVAIEEGQKYSEHQMLEMLMIPSGNNVARLLARWDAGTEKAFVEKMNKAAEDLGMTNSTYTDPSGLKSSTVSTPADQIKLGKAVMQSDVFREIVNLPQADIPNVGRIYNNNYILLEPGVSGIKTGSSTPAGGNLLWTADTVVDGTSRRIIGAVMGATLDGTLDAKLERARQNSLKLIQAAQKGVDSATVVKKGQVVGYVDNGFGTRTPVVATKDLKAVGWGGLQVDLELTDGGTTPAHVAKAGTVVGEVSVGTGTGKVSVPVALQSGMTEAGFGDKLTRIT